MMIALTKKACLVFASRIHSAVATVCTAMRPCVCQEDPGRIRLLKKKAVKMFVKKRKACLLVVAWIQIAVMT